MRAPDLQETPPAPAPPPPLRGPQEPPLLTAVWLRPAEELDSGTVPPSALLSGVYKITWQEDPTGVPQTFTDGSAHPPTRSAGSGPEGQLLLPFADKLIQLQNIRRPS